ncbi:SpoIID/LytB domain-containing protein [bacterium]|nr:SpoIID/LytB domain-containing protein [bacterium]
MKTKELGHSHVPLLLAFVCLASTMPFCFAGAPTETGHIDEMKVTVRLGAERQAVDLKCSPNAAKLQILDAATSAPLFKRWDFRAATIEAVGSSLVINDEAVATERLVIASSDGVVLIDQKPYRGKMEVALTGNSLLIVRNTLSLGDYLASVVGAEMPDSATAEALKAQSIVSRSYILHRMEKSEPNAGSVCDSVLSQVYAGRDSESPETIEAVKKTRNLVLTHKKHVIDACFFASSGGHTASAKDVWSSNVPYLKGRKDRFSEGGMYSSWELKLSAKAIERLLAKNGKRIGRLNKIVVKNRDKSGRVRTILLKGSAGKLNMRGVDFRILMGTRKLRSTMFQVKRQKDKFIFTGKGYGHGVGLSQWGACRMAETGYRCKQILKFYYRSVAISEYSGPLMTTVKGQ